MISLASKVVAKSSKWKLDIPYCLTRSGMNTSEEQKDHGETIELVRACDEER